MEYLAQRIQKLHYPDFVVSRKIQKYDQDEIDWDKFKDVEHYIPFLPDLEIHYYLSFEGIDVSGEYGYNSFFEEERNEFLKEVGQLKLTDVQELKGHIESKLLPLLKTELTNDGSGAYDIVVQTQFDYSTFHGEKFRTVDFAKQVCCKYFEALRAFDHFLLKEFDKIILTASSTISSESADQPEGNWKNFKKDQGRLFSDIADILVSEHECIDKSEAQTFCDLLNSNETNQIISWKKSARELYALLVGLKSNENFSARQVWDYFTGKIRYQGKKDQWKIVDSKFRKNVSPDLERGLSKKLFEFGQNL